MSDLRTDWPGRPTRTEFLQPRGLRERVGAVIAKPLLLRYDRELGAETMRSDDGWQGLVTLRSAWNAHFRTCDDKTQIQEWAEAPSNTASAS
jgi:hypothetical protein